MILITINSLKEILNDWKLIYYLLIIIIIAIVSGVLRFQKSSILVDRCQAAIYAEKKQILKTPTSFLGFNGLNVCMNVTPKSMFSKGIISENVSSYWIGNGEAPMEYRRLFSILYDDTINLDLVRFILIVLFVILIGISYDFVSNDIENNIIWLILSNSVSRVGYILGKWLALFVLGSFINIMVIGIWSAIYTIGFEVLPNMLIVFHYILSTEILIGIIISFVMLVSIYIKKKSLIVLVMMGGWLSFVFILPNLSYSLAKTIVKMPNYLMTEDDQLKIRIDGYHKFKEKYDKIVLSVLDVKERKRVAAIEESKIISEENKMFRDIDEKKLRIVKKQEKVARKMMILSPISDYINLNLNVAGNGLGHRYRYLEKVHRSNNLLNKFTLDTKTKVKISKDDLVRCAINGEIHNEDEVMFFYGKMIVWFIIAFGLLINGGLKISKEK